MKRQKGSESEDIPYLTLSKGGNLGLYKGTLEARGCSPTQVHLGRRVYRGRPQRIRRKTEQERKPIWERSENQEGKFSLGKGPRQGQVQF